MFSAWTPAHAFTREELHIAMLAKAISQTLCQNQYQMGIKATEKVMVVHKKLK